MILEQLIESLNAELGGEFQVEQNSCTIAFDDMEVTMLEFPEVDCVLLTGKVGEIPPYPPENLYAGLLMANHYFENTKGATFSLNPETKEIHLTRQLDSKNLNYEKFRAELENFVNTFETWLTSLKNYTGGEQEGQTAEELPTPDLGQDMFMRV